MNDFVFFGLFLTNNAKAAAKLPGSGGCVLIFCLSESVESKLVQEAAKTENFIELVKLEMRV